MCYQTELQHFILFAIWTAEAARKPSGGNSMTRGLSASEASEYEI